MGRAVTIGPFDRATLGWATVMPLWFASPWLAALLWRRLPQFADRAAVLALAAIIGTLVGGGWTVVALAASGLVRSGHRWRGLAVAVVLAVVQFGVVAVTLGLVAFAYMGCNRRP